jgi:hypothetical protein
VVHEDEVVAAKMLDVLERARLEVVDAENAMPLPEQVLAEMGAEEPRSAGDDCAGHEVRRIAGSPDRPFDSYEALTAPNRPLKLPRI